MTDRWLTDFKTRIRKSLPATVLLMRLKEWGYKVSFVLKIAADESTLGTCNVTTKIIRIRLYDDQDFPLAYYDIIRTLAHEYRHAWQGEKGKYMSYLAGKSNNILAIRCEQDAVAWAEKYVLNFDDSLKPFVYDFKRLVRRKNRKIGHV